MNAKTTLSISEARKKIFKIADEVQKSDVHYTLTEKGKPKVVVMSADEFDSWQETIEIVHDRELMERIRSAEEEIEKGHYVTLEDALKSIAYIDAQVSSRPRKVSRKRSIKNR